MKGASTFLTLTDDNIVTNTKDIPACRPADKQDPALNKRILCLAASAADEYGELANDANSGILRV